MGPESIPEVEKCVINLRSRIFKNSKTGKCLKTFDNSHYIEFQVDFSKYVIKNANISLDKIEHVTCIPFPHVT